MRKCNNCNIYIGGAVKSCPLCQNSLTGEASEKNWPSLSKFKKQAFLYKLQLFIVLAICVVALSLDFLMDVNINDHWSLVITACLMLLELLIRDFLKKNLVIAKIISRIAFYLALMLILIGWFWGFLNTVIYLIIPIMLSVTLIANFVFSLIDTAENALVYLLGNILISVIPYLVLFFIKHTRPIAWSVCLMLSVLTFIGIIVFKGPKVVKEVQKRMNI